VVVSVARHNAERAVMGAGLPPSAEQTGLWWRGWAPILPQDNFCGCDKPTWFVSGAASVIIPPWNQSTLESSHPGINPPWNQPTLESIHPGINPPWNQSTLESSHPGNNPPWNQPTLAGRPRSARCGSASPTAGRIAFLADLVSIPRCRRMLLMDAPNWSVADHVLYPGADLRGGARRVPLPPLAAPDTVDVMRVHRAQGILRNLVCIWKRFLSNSWGHVLIGTLMSNGDADCIIALLRPSIRGIMDA